MKKSKDVIQKQKLWLTAGPLGVWGFDLMLICDGDKMLWMETTAEKPF